MHFWFQAQQGFACELAGSWSVLAGTGTGAGALAVLASLRLQAREGKRLQQWHEVEY